MGSELAKAYVQIIPTTDGIKANLESALGKESEGVGEAAGDSIGKSIGSFIKKALLAIGIGDLIKNAIMDGANLEQSIGGVETLFKDSSDAVIDYAQNAWKTAGLSANAYMETATGFAASLLQGVAGDTQKAAEITDMAIIDMSDNANKMGTDMELIQNAYQGFAKQNYTMLDNLKLGYGGTKTEMERLLADAKELTGVDYDIDNLADVYNAIHVIQENLDITGTTAKEASTTISGSLNAVKGTWENLFADMTLGRDISGDIEALGESVLAAANNLLPAVKNLLGSAPKVIIEVMQELGPPLIEAGAETIAELASGIAQSLPDLISTGMDMLFTIGDAIIDNIDIIIGAGIELIIGLVTGLLNALPRLIAKVPVIISTILETLLGLIPDVIAAGINIFTSLVSDLPTIISDIVAIIPILIDSIISCIASLIPLIIDTGVELITALVDNLPLIIKEIIGVLPAIITSIINAFGILTPEIVEAGFQLFTSLVTLLPQIILMIVESAYEIVSSLIDAFVQSFTSFKDVGKQMLAGIWEGIKNGWSSLCNSVNGLIGSLVDNIKKTLGIHSPSRVFRDEVGKMVDLGLAEGITGNMNVVSSAIDDLSDAATADVVVDTLSKNNITVTSKPADEGLLMIAENTYRYLQETLPGIANMQLVMDSGAVVGQLAPAMDSELGRLAGRSERWIR